MVIQVLEAERDVALRKLGLAAVQARLEQALEMLR